jgi:hypothetical protein
MTNLMMGTDMVPETSVISHRPTRQIAQEDFINCSHQILHIETYVLKRRQDQRGNAVHLCSMAAQFQLPRYSC